MSALQGYFYNDLKKVFFQVWCIISFFIFISLISPFLVSGSTLLSFIPVCPSVKYYGTSCIACGLTRSFISISNLHLSEALNSNSYSLYVYAVFLLNETLFIRALSKIYSKHKKMKLCKQQV
jgi:hypothetical protein